MTAFITVLAILGISALMLICIAIAGYVLFFGTAYISHRITDFIENLRGRK